MARRIVRNRAGAGLAPSIRPSRLWNDESGISSVEYGLLLSFVAAGIMVAADLLSNAVENQITGAAGCIKGAPTC